MLRNYFIYCENNTKEKSIMLIKYFPLVLFFYNSKV